MGFCNLSLHFLVPILINVRYNECWNGGKQRGTFHLADWTVLSASRSRWLMALSTGKASHPILGFCLSGGVQVWQQIWNTSRMGNYLHFFFFWEKEKLEGQMPVLGAQPYFISLEQSTEAHHTYSMSSQDVTPSWFVFSFLFVHHYWSGTCYWFLITTLWRKMP